MASLRSLIVKIGADTTDVEKALASVGESAKTLDAGLKKLGNTEIGRKAIAGAEELIKTIQGLRAAQKELADNAVLAARGLEAIGGPARLMKTELDQVAKSVARGLDAFRALGQQAPAELEKVNAAIEKQQALLKSGGLVKSFASGLPGGALLTGGIAAAGAAAGAAFAVAAKHALSYADALTKISDRTGIDVVALQRLDGIARASGNSLEEIGTAVNRFQRNLASNDRTAGDALARLGLSFAQLRELSPDEQFIAIAKGLQSIVDPAQQALLATQLFGKGGVEILPSLKAKVDELAASTVVMSKESVEALDAFGDGLTKLKAAGIAAAGELVAAFLKVPKAIKDAADKLPQQSDLVIQDPRETARLQQALAKGPAQFAQAQQGPTVADIDALSGALGRAATNAEKLSEIKPPELASPEDIARIEREGHALLQAAEFALKVADAQKQLFGTDVIERSRVLVAALGETANVSKLTVDQQKALQQSAAQALEAYKALGEQAPEALKKVKAEVDTLLFAQSGRQTVSGLGGLASTAGTLFSQDEFRNIAEGFERDGTLIDETLDGMAEHARKTKEAFEAFFGATADASLALPNIAPGNGQQIKDARRDIELAKEATENWAVALDLVVDDLGLLAQSADRGTARILRGIRGVIAGVRELIVQLQAAAVAAAFLDFLKGFGTGLAIASSFVSGGGIVTASGVRGFTRGGRVPSDGMQYFGVGGKVLPFLTRGTDTVPAMLTPGEIVLNKGQQREIAGALNSGGGPTIVNNWAGVIMTPDVYRNIARKSLPYTVQNIAENKDGQRSRLLAGLGARS